MNGLALTLLIIFGILLIGTILLQPGTKGGLGASFGGGGANSAFGAQGATPFLSKATYWLAGGFLATTLFIEVLIIRQNRSVLDKTAALQALKAGEDLYGAVLSNGGRSLSIRTK